MIPLDTHVLLWQEQGDRRLGPQTRRAIERALRESKAIAASVGVRALNEPKQWGPSDHCILRIEVT